jgi:hypothetical protein
MSDATQGPWTVSDWFGNVVVKAGNADIICTVYKGWTGDKTLTQKANARVIAAAPALLSAAQDLVAAVERRGDATTALVACKRAIAVAAEGEKK